MMAYSYSSDSNKPLCLLLAAKDNEDIILEDDH